MKAKNIKLWEVLEVWRAGFFSNRGEAEDNEQGKKRDKIGNIFCNYLNELDLLSKPLMRDIKARNIDGNEKTEFVPALNSIGKEIYYIDNIPIKYLRLPLMYVSLDNFENCFCGIRVNVCLGQSLSKIFIYIAKEREKSEERFSNEDLYNFKKLSLEKCEKIERMILEEYCKVLEETPEISGYKVEKTPYEVKIYNLGTTSEGIRKFVEATNNEEARNCLRDKEAEKAFITTASLAGEIFDEVYDKNDFTLKKLKDRLDELPEQVFIPSEPITSKDFIDSIEHHHYPETISRELSKGWYRGLYIQSIRNDSHVTYGGIVPTYSWRKVHLPARNIATACAMNL
jgi:hypothetical protein